VVYKTPEEVYDAYVAARVRQDWKAAIECMTDETRDEMLTLLLLAVNLAHSSAKTLEEKAQFIPILDVFEKYGPLESVKDRTAYYADLIAAIQRTPDNLLLQSAAKSLSVHYKDVKLEELKIQGDTATGVVVVQSSGKEVREQINFKKVGAGWKINLTD
jgi:hypothetical protein